MPQPDGMEHRILNYALTVGGSEGRTATWAELRRSIAEETGECRDDELRQAFVHLHSRRYITLQKWDEARSRFRGFGEYQSMYEFFMRGSFRVIATTEGCAFWEALLYEQAAPAQLSISQSEQMVPRDNGWTR